MNLASLDSFPGSGIGPLFGNGLQSGAFGNFNSGANGNGVGQTSDSSELSPLAQMFSSLQQGQGSDPTQAQLLTQLIATSLQEVAQSNQPGGGSTLANQFAQLASGLANSSNTGGASGAGVQAQAEESVASVQISFSEISESAVVEDGTNGGSSGQAGSSNGGQAVQQQLQESALAIQINFSETSISSATQGATPSDNNVNSAEEQQLNALMALLQNATQSAQTNDLSTRDLRAALSGDGGQPGAFQAAAGGSYRGSNDGTSGAGSSIDSQGVQQQLQVSLLAYQVDFSESSTSGTFASIG